MHQQGVALSLDTTSSEKGTTMKVLVYALLSIWIFSSSMAQAFTRNEAQACAQKLLDAYNTRTYPRDNLAIDAIVQSAFGPIFRTFSESEKTLALEVGEQHIQESFTKPSGKYRYWDLEVTAVEKSKTGYRVIGYVSVQTPSASGRYNFLALVGKKGCQIRQVRVADVVTLVDQLKNYLSSDSRINHLFKS
ncbi:MAG: hypothetical protein V4606_01305 [Patescibacteria group bacterium]